MDCVKILGEWDVVLPDYRVLHCHQNANWEEGRLRSMHAHLKPGMVLYDVGAEHGDLSCLLATFVAGYGGGVVLVEGSDKFWPVMRATFEANGLVPIACWAGFASNIDSPESERGPGWGEVSLTVGNDWPTWAGPSLGGAEPQLHYGFKSLVESKQTIPNIRFDSLAEIVGAPDVINIDVEGAEGLVLRGSERLLREHRPLVWVSLHPQLLWFDYPEWPGMTADDVKHWFREFMAGYEYDAHFIEDNHESHYFCVPSERDDIDPRAGIEYLVQYRGPTG